ncbi:hypothetical protein niasHT_014609 [Heterodera trifolii]|uniref:Uncharacterized protein n=1 Tax=Heterodera trifolii TaxID=157864 RepID=A0ABD2LHU4_9BILA
MASSSNLSPSEELRLLRDRIKELEQMKKGGQNEGNCANSVAEQQKEMKELRKKFAKMEMREAKHLSKIDELEKQNGESAEARKVEGSNTLDCVTDGTRQLGPHVWAASSESEQQKLSADRNLLQAKMAKMEKKQKKRKKEKEKYTAAFAQIMQLQAEKNNLLDKISQNEEATASKGKFVLFRFVANFTDFA